MPETAAERRAVQEQLDRILSSPLFKNSKRYPNLLRFAVERALNGHTEAIKERTIGLEVFGRDADYDTNADPVVRTTAVEIRKRIAQYYHESGHEAEIRIDFPPGSYLPEFRLPQKPPVAQAVTVEAPVEKAPPRRGRFLVYLTLAAALVLGAGLWMMGGRPKPAIDLFWGPVLNAREAVLIYVGGSPEAPALQAGSSLTDLHHFERVGYADATALANIASFFSTRNKPYRIRFQTFGKLDELKDGPAVLIGAFNNTWALRLTEQLRFSFARDLDTHVSRIQDRQDPHSLKWSHRMDDPYAAVSTDYAILSRVLDPTTGEIVVTASGLAKFGTAAVGEFLTNPAAFDEIANRGPKDWYRKNMQVVISASVVGLSSGPGHVVTAWFW